MRTLPKWWQTWKRRWGWLSHLDSAISWGQRLWPPFKWLLRGVIALGGAFWAFLQQNWIPLLGIVGALLWILGEWLLQRSRLPVPDRAQPKFPKGEVLQGPRPKEYVPTAKHVLPKSDEAQSFGQLVTIRLPSELLPGQIDNHKFRYLPRVWIVRHTSESRLLEFKLEVPGYEFLNAHDFQEIYQEHPKFQAAYFSNPLDVSWLNRQAKLAFIIASGQGNDSQFALMVRDVFAGQTFILEPGATWSCFSDGTVHG